LAGYIEEHGVTDKQARLPWDKLPLHFQPLREIQEATPEVASKEASNS
jgi:hypothetical protein